MTTNTSEQNTPAFKLSVLLQRLWQEEVSRKTPKLLLAIFCMVIAAITTALLANIMDPAIKQIMSEDRQSFWLYIPGTIILLSLVKATVAYGQSRLLGEIGQQIVSSLQKKLYHRLIQADLQWLQRHHSSQYITSFVNDAVVIRDVISTLLVAVCKDSLTLIGCSIVMFWQDWRLASFSLFIFLPAALFVKRLTRKSRHAAIRQFQETSNLSRLISEMIRGIRIVRIYGQQQKEIEHATNTIHKRLHYLTQAVRARAASAPITEALTGFGIALVLIYTGAAGYGENKIGLNNFMAFFTAMMLAYQPARALSGVATRIQDALTAAERVYHMIDQKPSIINRPDAIDFAASNIFVEFKDVCFSYHKDKENTLSDINFTIQAGQKIALVGRSGSGKTTILNLLARFYEVNHGAIYFNNIAIQDMTLESLHRHIALVGQDAFLFDGSIADNIAYGLPHGQQTTTSEIMRAAQAADAMEFIDALPQGLDTNVGESGQFLSGGQKQRIAIARAMLKNAPLLLLDEATSALDTQSQTQIHQALNRLMKGRTTVVIAHRLSTIYDADQILVIEQGQIIEQGQHQELLNAQGIYYQLHQQQGSR